MERRARNTPGDHAGGHGSFPMPDQAHADAAARLVGRAPDPGKVKAKILEIDRRKGFSPPKKWLNDGD